MTFLLILMTSLTIGLSMAGKIDHNFDESENLIEPKKDTWTVLHQPKDKTFLLKNVILALQKFNRKKTRPLKAEGRELVGDSTPSGEISERTTTAGNRRDNQDEAGNKVPANSPPVSMFSNVFPSLHLLTEDKNRFTHSIVDGWTY